MLIEGPLKIEIAEPADGQGKVLVIAFQPDFQALDLSAQAASFGDYLDTLGRYTRGELPIDARNRAGMLVVQQVAEQLLPHIVSGDLALDETMTVQIRQEEQAGSLVDLLDTPPRD